MKHGFLTPLVRHPNAPNRIFNQRTGAVLADRIHGAFDSGARRAGLLGRDTFPDGHAMVIAPTNAVHTFFMRFPIDLAFVDKNGQVVKTCAAVKPWRLAAALRAFAVIELPAGSLARSDTAKGDRLSIAP